MCPPGRDIPHSHPCRANSHHLKTHSPFTHVEQIQTAHHGRTHRSAPTAFGEMVRKREIFGNPVAFRAERSKSSRYSPLRSPAKPIYPFATPRFIRTTEPPPVGADPCVRPAGTTSVLIPLRRIRVTSKRVPLLPTHSKFELPTTGGHIGPPLRPSRKCCGNGGLLVNRVPARRNGQGRSLHILLRSLIKSHRNISRQICSKFTVGFLYPNHAETHLLKILGNSSKYRAEKGRKQTYNRLHLQVRSRKAAMSRDVEFCHRDRLIELGLTIAALRKMQGMSQETLAEKARISRSHLSSIEAPNIIQSFSVEILFNIADALHIRAGDLLNASFATQNTV